MDGWMDGIVYIHSIVYMLCWSNSSYIWSVKDLVLRQRISTEVRVPPGVHV